MLMLVLHLLTFHHDIIIATFPKTFNSPMSVVPLHHGSRGIFHLAGEDEEIYADLDGRVP
jgi:hypothetical protein